MKMKNYYQQAVAQVLSPLFEVDFSDSSHGLPTLHSGHASFAPRQLMMRYRAGCIPSWPFRSKSGGRDGGGLAGRPPPCGGMRPEIVLRYGQPPQPDGSDPGKGQVSQALGLIRLFLTAGVELPDGTLEATPL